MIDRQHIERFLHLNGLDQLASDEEIRTLLISARWHKDDVEAALVVLRENAENKTQHIDSIHTRYTAGEKLNPETLSSLFGMDVQLQAFSTEHTNRLRRRYRSQLVSIAVFSFVSAVLFLVSIMWIMDIGFFMSTHLALT